MRAAVSILCMLSLTACFPHNARHRTIAQIVEGGVLAGGVAILAVSNTGADCDQMVGLGMPKADCQSRANLASGVGLSMVLAGLVGFMATVSTAAEDQPAPAPASQTMTSQPAKPLPQPNQPK